MRPANFVIPTLSILAGCLVAVVVWGGQSQAEQALQQELTRFRGMSPEDQDRIRANHKAFSGSDGTRQSEVRELHLAVHSDPDLARMLQEFNAWRSGLDRFEKDKLQTEIRAGDAGAVAVQMANSRQNANQFVIPFPEYGFRRFSSYRESAIAESRKYEGQGWIAPLIISHSEYAAILNKAFPDESFTADQLSQLAELTTENERSLLKSLLVTERIRDNGNLFDSVRGFVEILRREAPDDGWRQEFGKRIAAMGDDSQSRGQRSREFVLARFPILIAVLTIFDQAIIDLGAGLHTEFAAKPGEILDEFAAIDDPIVRRELMSLQPEAAVDRLQRMAAADRDETSDPRRLLYRRRIAYEESIADISRTLQRAFGMPGPPGPPGPPGEDRGRSEKDRRGP